MIVSRTAMIYCAAIAAMAGVAVLLMSSDRTRLPPQPVFGDQRQPQGGQSEAALAPLGGADVASLAARTVAADVVAPPASAGHPLQRVAARPPLGDLGVAAQPRRTRSGDWQDTLLYRPVVTSSASFETMGYVISIADVEAVPLGKTCDYEGVTWSCGGRAMLAFRYWLRGRALVCAVKPAADRVAAAVPCRLGKQDVGAWLVANGWALARPGGAYEKAESVARSARMGIFGPPG